MMNCLLTVKPRLLSSLRKADANFSSKCRWKNSIRLTHSTTFWATIIPNLQLGKGPRERKISGQAGVKG